MINFERQLQVREMNEGCGLEVIQEDGRGAKVPPETLHAPRNINGRGL